MSNYIDSLNNSYRNSYSYKKASTSQFNNAPLEYGKRSAASNSYVNSTAINNTTSLRSAAEKMSAALQDITKESSFVSTTAESSNSGAVSINTSIFSKSPDRYFPTTSIQVSQVATGQTNTGSEIKADEAYSGNEGVQKFAIDIGGKTTQFEIEVKAGDTNSDVQKKMMAAINAENVGVTASVTTNGGNSQLSIRTSQTGEDNNMASFSITDVDGGDLVASTGVDNQTQAAQDAIFSVNGAEQRSISNNVNLGGNVMVTLQKATDEPVEISVKNDTSVGVKKMQDFVKGFNDLMSAARNSTNGNSRLQGDLISTVNSYMTTLNKMGISMEKDGSLSVDSKKLEAAANDGSLEQYFTSHDKANFGIASRLDAVAKNINRNPTQYINVSQEKQSINVSNMSADDWDQVSSSRNFNAVRYNSYQNTYALVGMMFNIYT